MVYTKEPNEITLARDLLAEWENTNWECADSDIHLRAFDKFKMAYKLFKLDKWSGGEFESLVVNLRITHARRLYHIMDSISSTASSSAYFALLLSNLEISDDERDLIFKKDPKLAESFKRLIDLRGDELDDFIRTLERKQSK
jgi:hypothetical protein